MDKHISFMALYSHTIVEKLAQIQNIPEIKALDLFYNSKFYGIYEKENTKLWHFSNVALTDMLYREITTGQIDFPVEG